jgi:hypothetical protein
MFAPALMVLVTRIVPITSILYRGKLLLTPTLFVALFTKSVLLMEVIYLSRGILFVGLDEFCHYCRHLAYEGVIGGLEG